MQTETKPLRTAGPNAFDNTGPRWMLLTRITPRTSEPKPVEPVKGAPYPHKHAWIVRWSRRGKVVESDTIKELEVKIRANKGSVSYALKAKRPVNGGKVKKIPAPKVRP